MSSSVLGKLAMSFSLPCPRQNLRRGLPRLPEASARKAIPKEDGRAPAPPQLITYQDSQTTMAMLLLSCGPHCCGYTTTSYSPEKCLRLPKSYLAPYVQQLPEANLAPPPLASLLETTRAGNLARWVRFAMLPLEDNLVVRFVKSIQRGSIECGAELQEQIGQAATHTLTTKISQIPLIAWGR